MSAMKIVFGGPRWYYGNEALGDSYEYIHLVGSLEDAGYTVRYVDTMGADDVTGQLVRWCADSQVCIVSVVEGEIDWARLAAGKGECKLVVLISDHQWRRELTAAITPFVDYVLCNAPNAEWIFKEKWLPWEWGARAALYPECDAEKIHEVVFLGQRYGERGLAIDILRDGGIEPYVRGMGWGDGQQVNGAQIPYILQRSKVGLNLSATSQGGMKQIKARPFEVAASGAVLLCEYVPGIEDCFVDGKEAIFFQTLAEMVYKAQDALDDEKMRARMSVAGRKRALKDHTYAIRWARAFEAMGFARREKRKTVKRRSKKPVAVLEE